MKKTTLKIESLAKDLINQSSDDITSNNIIIVITLPFNGFYRRFKSISQFFRTLTNGKNTLTGLRTNRDWFTHLDASGFYRYNITREFVEITLVIKTQKQFSELEFNSRVQKLIKPINITFAYNEKYLLNKKFIDILSLETGMEVFGDYKKSKL